MQDALCDCTFWTLSWICIIVIKCNCNPTCQPAYAMEQFADCEGSLQIRNDLEEQFLICQEIFHVCCNAGKHFSHASSH